MAKGSKKENSPDRDIGPYVDAWRDGHKVGTEGGFRWSIETAVELASRAKSEDGRKALEFMAELIRKERDRRYPPKVEHA